MLEAQITNILFSAMNWKGVLKIKEYSLTVWNTIAKLCKMLHLNVLLVVLQVFIRQCISCLLHTENVRSILPISS